MPLAQRHRSHHAADVARTTGHQQLHPASRSLRAASSGSTSLIQTPMPDSLPARYFSLPAHAGWTAPAGAARTPGTLTGHRPAPGATPRYTAAARRTVRQGAAACQGTERRTRPVPDRRDPGGWAPAGPGKAAPRTASGPPRARTRPSARSGRRSGCWPRVHRRQARRTGSPARPRRRPGLPEHPLGPRGDERVAVDLPVRMAERDADLLTPVLEAVDLLDARHTGKHHGAVHPGLQHGADPPGAQARERGVVVGSEADHLAPADGRTARHARRSSGPPGRDTECCGMAGSPARAAAWPPAPQRREPVLEYHHVVVAAGISVSLPARDGPSGHPRPAAGTSGPGAGRR